MKFNSKQRDATWDKQQTVGWFHEIPQYFTYVLLVESYYSQKQATQ